MQLLFVSMVTLFFKQSIAFSTLNRRTGIKKCQAQRKVNEIGIPWRGSWNHLELWHVYEIDRTMRGNTFFERFSRDALTRQRNR